MGEFHPILATIKQYEEMLRKSPEHPERRTIEMLLAKERERLREEADVGLPSLQPKVEDAASPPPEEDVAEGDGDGNGE